MEFYPQCQTQQLAPVMVLCLGDGECKTVLKRHFDAANIDGKVWDSSMLKNRLLNSKYIIQYRENEAKVYSTINSHKTKSVGEHSKLSPFNTESDLFPNGILSPKWFHKYISELPFVVISVYALGDRNGDEELGAELALARTRYSDVGVWFVAIIVSSGTDADADIERTALLRQISGLARLSGLFYLNTSPETLDRDCEVLASTLFNNLKTYATDFYSAVEHKVRQRYRKYYTIPPTNADTRISMDPKFLEIRNLIKQAMLSQLMHPHNVESSLSTLEHAYESLINLLKELLPEFASTTVTAHDANLYRQFRNLLDIIAIHLIRGYISIEEPVAALRKHSAHIANVLDASLSIPEVDESIWLSIQYQWLAEFMKVVPSTVLTDLHKVTKGKNKSNQKSITYYGGITFHDKFYSKVVTESSLLYVKAARQLDSVHLSNSSLAYLQVCSDKKSVRSHKIKLLEAAKLYLDGITSSNEGPFKTLNCLLDWLIGEEYMAVGKFSEAVDHYQRSLKERGDTPWDTVTEFVTKKIMLALAELNDSQEYLRHLAKLSILKTKHYSKLSLPQLQLLQSEYEINVEFGKFLDLDVLVFEKNLRNETHAYDTVVTQIILSSNFDFALLKSLIPNSLVEIFAEKIEVSYAERRQVCLKRGKSTNVELEILKIELGKEYSTNLEDLNEKRIIQLEEVISDPGWYEVDRLTIQMKVRIRAPKVTVVFLHSETHTFDALQIAHSKKIYGKRDEKLISKLMRLVSRSANKLMVLPYRPDIGIKMSFPFSTIIVGEKLDVVFEVSHRKLLVQVMKFSSVTLQARTLILENEVEKEDLLVQTNWEELKDDEPLSILNIINSDQISCSKTLRMSVRKPPSTISNQKDLRVVLEIKLLVTELTGVVSVYELDTYLLPIVIEPFGSQLSVSPKCDPSGELEMPNPFILGVDSVNSNKDYSMPLPSRTWRVSVSLDDKMKLIESGDIEITKSFINLKSKNAEIIVETVELTTMVGGQARQLFKTKSKHRFTDRNVTVVANAVFEWKRKGKDVINQYETDEWEVPIPLQDPRILFQVKDHEREHMELVYTIENPTPRILTFTTSLSTDEAALQGTIWDFENLQNLVPLKQSAFPVLPFSQYLMVYHGTYKLDKEIQDIQLPNLQVYDVNYKVSLPTLPLDDEVTSDKSALYIKDKHTQ